MRRKQSARAELQEDGNPGEGFPPDLSRRCAPNFVFFRALQLRNNKNEKRETETATETATETETETGNNNSNRNRNSNRILIYIFLPVSRERYLPLVKFHASESKPQEQL